MATLPDPFPGDNILINLVVTYAAVSGQSTSSKIMILSNKKYG
jgi:hypothetical protein